MRLCISLSWHDNQTVTITVWHIFALLSVQCPQPLLFSSFFLSFFFGSSCVENMMLLSVVIRWNVNLEMCLLMLLAVLVCLCLVLTVLCPELWSRTLNSDLWFFLVFVSGVEEFWRCYSSWDDLVWLSGCLWFLFDFLFIYYYFYFYFFGGRVFLCCCCFCFVFCSFLRCLETFKTFFASAESA